MNFDKQGYAIPTIKLAEGKCSVCGYPYLVESYHDNEHIKTICLRCQHLNYWVVRKGK